MTDMTRNLTQREIDGNNSMRHYMPVPINHLHSLRSRLESAAARLQPLDAFKHDELIPDSVWEQVRENDPVPLCLCNSVRHLELSLQQLRDAQHSVEGIFGGEDRDRYEEPLSRGVRGAEDRLARMRQCMETYETPRQPFAIRRGTLYTLETLFDSHATTWEKIVECCRGASDDLMADLGEQVRELRRLCSVISKLRKMPSQRMTDHLSEISARFDAVIARLDEIQGTACKRILGPDRRVIRAAA